MYLQELFGFAHPEYGHVPMLLAPDGRRLSKRDKDLDLGVLRQRLKPEELIGNLAFAAGLIEKNVPISAAELAAMGHEVEVVTSNIDMGRGQIIWRTGNGMYIGGTEPRCDGTVAAW